MSQFNDEDVQAVLGQVQRARFNDRRARRNEHLITLAFLAVVLLVQTNIISEIRAIPVRCELPSVLGLN